MRGRIFPQLDDAAVEAIAGQFAAVAHVEPYTPDGSPVYRIDPGGAADGIRMILGPSLRRVDVSSAGSHSWVLKNIGEVEIIPGVEVVFRPSEGRGFLFVAVSGFVNMVMG